MSLYFKNTANEKVVIVSANAYVGQSLIPILQSNGYFVTALVHANPPNSEQMR